MAELVDARDLKSLDGNVVWVRVPTARTNKIKQLGIMNVLVFFPMQSIQFGDWTL